MTLHSEDDPPGYQLTGQPVRGGSSMVFQAIDVATGQPVAIKRLDPGADLGRLRREARLLARLDVEGVAHFHRLIDWGGQSALVTDWVAGTTLASSMDRDGPMAVDRAVDLIGGIAETLAVLHQRGVVHRDVKPSNIMVTDGGARATLIDFGLGRDSGAATVTAEGTLAGTPRYLAPEVIEGAEPTAAADQYALGIIFHELVTGRWPFPETDAMATAIHHQLHHDPEPLDEAVPGVEPHLSEVIGRSLAKDPDQRFPSVASMAAALADPDSAGGLSGPSNRSTRFIAAATVLAVVAVVAAGILIAGSLQSPDGEPADEQQVAADEQRTEVDEPDPVTRVAAWDAGLADQLGPCNLLTARTFETNDLPDNYFADGDDLTRPLAVVAADGGVDDSGALVIGATGYGLWGEIIPVVGGASYRFSANVAIDGEVGTSELSIIWLNGDFTEIAQSEPIDLLVDAPGQLTLSPPAAPFDARFAVPRLYKDEAPGVLVADELVFTTVGTECGQVVLGR